MFKCDELMFKNINEVATHTKKKKGRGVKDTTIYGNEVSLLRNSPFPEM